LFTDFDSLSFQALYSAIDLSDVADHYLAISEGISNGLASHLKFFLVPSISLAPRAAP
jgi:hypothetical protein